LNPFAANGTKPNPVQVPRGNVQTPISIQLSYRIPTYTFRKEGDFVVDALSYGTNVINQTLWVANPKAVGTKQPRKMPL